MTSSKQPEKAEIITAADTFTSLSDCVTSRLEGAERILEGVQSHGTNARLRGEIFHSLGDRDLTLPWHFTWMPNARTANPPRSQVAETFFLLLTQPLVPFKLVCLASGLLFKTSLLIESSASPSTCASERSRLRSSSNRRAAFNLRGKYGTSPCLCQAGILYSELGPRTGRLGSCRSLSNDLLAIQHEESSSCCKPLPGTEYRDRTPTCAKSRSN